MARVSSNPADSYKMKSGFNEGIAEITEAQALVFQFPPNKQTGAQDPPALYAQLTLQVCAKDGTSRAADTQEALLKIQGPNKLTGELDRFRPGNAETPDSEDVADLGGALGTAGNTVYAAQEGQGLLDNTKWIHFCRSLVEKGFKPEVLARTYFPDLIGLRANFETVTGKKFRASDTGSDPSYLVVSEIYQYPYERAATAAKKGPAATGKPAKPAAAEQGNQTAVATAAPPSSNASTDAEAAALQVLRDTTAAHAGETVPDLKKVRLHAMLVLKKSGIPRASHKAIEDLLRDNDWLELNGAGEDMFFAGDGGITYAG